MSLLYRHPMFIVGLAIRLLMIGLLVPTPVVDWYVPFLDFSVQAPTLDPWGAWLSSGGTPAAFPYGYAMWQQTFSGCPSSTHTS